MGGTLVAAGHGVAGQQRAPRPVGGGVANTAQPAEERQLHTSYL